KQAIETLEENECNPGDIVDAFNKRINRSGCSPTLTTRPEGFKTAILPVVHVPINTCADGSCQALTAHLNKETANDCTKFERHSPATGVLEIGIGHNHGESKMLTVRKFPKLFEVIGYAEENEEWIKKLGNLKRYDEMMKDFYSFIIGEKENPFTYEHEYAVQEVLDEVVGGVKYYEQIID
ncbi:MAG: hypothetical protein IIU65_00955, partial [Clostridia bacterium]|nr:hypothetical protein [Clostridia bacterium]